MGEEKDFAKTTYIGGNYIEIVNGNKITYAKKHVVQSNKQIIITAKDGIKHGTPEKTPKTLKGNKIIKVSLNLFFDGTQNNRNNTEKREKNTAEYKKEGDKKSDSYENDLSNVARGYKAIDSNAVNQVSRYIEGIGTVNNDSDYVANGVAFGEGQTGVKAKVAKGCVEGAKALSKYQGKDIELVVNVYGFSRGAAAARHFLYVASRQATTVKMGKKGFVKALPPDSYLDRDEKAQKTISKNVTVEIEENHPMLAYGYFGACLKKYAVTPKKIIFKFAGLYDTVASYGIDHRGGAFVDNDTVQLGLNAVNKVKFVLHLTALDEHRDNFDLSNINSAGLNGLQINLPGVHSDIGGSYRDNLVERNILMELYTFEDNCKKFAAILEKEGWYAKNQLEIKKESEGLLRLIGTRKLRNAYHKIALETVFYYSKEFDVKYLDSKVTDESVKNTNDAFLIQVNEQLKAYKSACNELRNKYVKKEINDSNYLTRLRQIDYKKYIKPDDLKKLRKEYFHWSAKASFGIEPRVKYPATETQRTRNIQNG
jgi:uncharacterized protein (DUF2235 family)